MKNKKKISYVLLLVVGILLLAACGKNPSLTVEIIKKHHFAQYL